MATISDYAQLQARCQRILDELDVPRPYSRDTVVRWMEDLRGRPLLLRELPPQAAQTGACGLWLGTDDADFVFYETRTAPHHQEHIILHEIGHMLCGHHHTPDTEIDGGLENLLRDLKPHLIKRLMARTSYTSVQEQEAEMLASLLNSSAALPRSGGTLGRLGALLGVRADGRHLNSPTTSAASASS